MMQVLLEERVVRLDDGESESARDFHADPVRDERSLHVQQRVASLCGIADPDRRLPDVDYANKGCATSRLPAAKPPPRAAPAATSVG